MAEVEIHTGHGHAADDHGQKVGILVGIIGVLLSVVTILGHREHTAAIVHKTEANDLWAYYQAKKIRQNTAEVGGELVGALASDGTKAEAANAKLAQQSQRFAKEADDLQSQAKDRDSESTRSEARALRYDFGEGFLELGLVMCSLYFLAHNRFFVTFGSIAAAAGTLTAFTGVLNLWL